MTDKFKVGDRIVAVEDDLPFKKGVTAVVVQCEGDGSPLVRCTSGDCESWIDDDYWELAPADKIDWTAPLEAYHPDGRVVEVELSDPRDIFTKANPDRDGDYWVSGLEEYEDICCRVNGRTDDDNWRIRNRRPTEAPSPELVERVFALMKRITREALSTDHQREARAILAELEPTDPDLIEAREVVVGMARNVEEHGLLVQAALAAIKRGREMEREGRP